MCKKNLPWWQVVLVSDPKIIYFYKIYFPGKILGNPATIAFALGLFVLRPHLSMSLPFTSINYLVFI